MLRYQLLACLADGAFHSGQALGEMLGMSRTAVWKHIKALEQMGMTIFSVPGKGYQLSQTIELLAPDYIRDALSRYADDWACLDVLTEVGSTNDFLLARQAQLGDKVGICLAESQTQGRGRRGRTWVSPFAANMYLSFSYPFHCGVAGLSGLSLAVAVAVAQALEPLLDKLLGKKLQLKWPNDIWCDGKKLAGILLDLQGESQGPCRVVMGVGVNVAMPQAADIDQAWTDLRQLGCVLPVRNRLAVALIESLWAMSQTFETQGLVPFLPAWRARDVLYQQPVVLHQAKQSVSGQAQGVNPRGELLLQTDEGLRQVAGGEVSVRFQT